MTFEIIPIGLVLFTTFVLFPVLLLVLKYEEKRENKKDRQTFYSLSFAIISMWCVMITFLDSPQDAEKDKIVRVGQSIYCVSDERVTIFDKGKVVFDMDVERGITVDKVTGAKR